MLPIGNDISNDDLDLVTQPSKTWALDFINGRVSSEPLLDGKSAMEQAILKALSTKRYRNDIYDFDYGSEIEKLLGKDELFVKSEVKRLVTEALLQDDRISAVNNFRFEFNRGDMMVKFTLVTMFGYLEMEANINV